MFRLVFLVLFVFINTSFSSIPWPAKVDYFDQYIDHYSFSSLSGKKFKQKYLYEDKFFNGNGPIFFYCGNEGAIEAFWNNTGFMFEIAPIFNALIVFGEHRYYGESMPFEDSFKQPNIQFLSIEQAIGDYVYLIKEIKIKFKASKSPVITFGGSYGGELAAYMRMRYPDFVIGALSASSPLYWTSGEKNLHDFFVAVTKDYEDANPKCPTLFKSAFDKIIEMKSYKQVSKLMQVCDEIKNKAELNWMMKWARNAFVMMSMMDYPYPSSFMSVLPANPVNASCDAALKMSDPIEGLREAVGVLYSKDPVRKCFDYKTQYIECADITGCGLGNDSKAWDFQACTQIHLYDDSKPTTDMFPDLPLTKSFVERYCYLKWGVVRHEKQLSTLFPLNDWSKYSNIIFSNGVRDPWKNGGILDSPSSGIKSIIIEGGAHHLDLRSSDKSDPQSVIEARILEIKTIKEWIKSYHA